MFCMSLVLDHNNYSGRERKRLTASPRVDCVLAVEGCAHTAKWCGCYRPSWLSVTSGVWHNSYCSTEPWWFTANCMQRTVVLVLGRAVCPLSGVGRLAATQRFQNIAQCGGCHCPSPFLFFPSRYILTVFKLAPPVIQLYAF